MMHIWERDTRKGDLNKSSKGFTGQGPLSSKNIQKISTQGKTTAGYSRRQQLIHNK